MHYPQINYRCPRPSSRFTRALTAHRAPVQTPPAPLIPMYRRCSPPDSNAPVFAVRRRSGLPCCVERRCPTANGSPKKVEKVELPAAALYLSIPACLVNKSRRPELSSVIAKRLLQNSDIPIKNHHTNKRAAKNATTILHARLPKKLSSSPIRDEHSPHLTHGTPSLACSK